jgi:hypothetical protein
MRKKEAIPTLLEALPEHRVWIVRNPIIQAFEVISSRDAIPALQVVVHNDSLRDNRLRVRKAIDHLSQV